MKSRDQDHPGQHGKTPSLLKIQKISWAWWCVPVIPATREAEAGELPEPRRQRLRWAGITPLHSSLGNKSETPSQKNNNNNKINKERKNHNLSLLTCGLHIGLPPRNYSIERGGKDELHSGETWQTVTEPGTSFIKTSISTDKSCQYVLWWEGLFISVVCSPNP